MARVKDWMIDMDDYVYEACSRGMSLKETLVYVRSQMKNVDSSYVEKKYRQIAND